MKTSIESFIQQRNRLMIFILWEFYVLMTITYFAFDPDFSTIWPPVGLFVCLSLTLIKKLLRNEKLMMYVIVFAIFAYLFYLNVQYPYLVNYMFILFGIILSSLYQHYRVILFSGVLATTSLIYFFIFSFDEIFMSIEQTDIIYFILYSLLLVLFFLFHSRFTKSLWVSAHQQEQKTKKKLQSTESYLNALFAQTHEAIIVYDKRDTIINVNRAFSHLYGWSHGEMIGNQLTQFLKFDKSNTEEVEMLHHDRWDKPFFIAISTSSIRENSGEIVAYSAIIRDITKRKRTEEQLIQSEKLNVIGKMAAGIAHEIRNPITVLSGFTQLMEDHKHKKMMQSELDRIDKIVGNLLAMAKPKMEQTVMSFKNLLEEVTDLYSQVFLDRQVTLKWNHVANTTIYGDKNRLKQVLINIFKNALEAIDHKGIIDISISDHESQIHIEIANNGPSIPQNIIDDVSSAFFTTKETGTGLGLMISTMIIEEHNGHFSIDNQDSGGVVVSLSLPKHEEEA